MNKEWVSQKEKQRLDEIKSIEAKIKKKFKDSGIEEYSDMLIKDTEELHATFLIVSNTFKHIEHTIKNKEVQHILKEKILQVGHEAHDELEKLFNLNYSYNRFLDSDPMEFDGDIIITDPCYVLREDSQDDEWEKCFCGEHMEKLGINGISRDTLYGDWSCSVYNTDSHRKIGQFCADAGMVAVLPLADVLKYNPSFDYHIQRKWTTTLIKNFTGTVQFIIDEVHFNYDGKDCTDYEVKVIGHGINKRSKKPINFMSTQTGL